MVDRHDISWLALAMSTHLTTVRDVLRAIGDARSPGGFVGIAATTGFSEQAVSRWASLSLFPARHYVWMQRELGRLGYTAPATLWGMCLLDGLGQ